MTQQGKPQAGDRVGYGVLFPLRFVGGDFESGSGFELVKASAEIIIGAESASEDGKSRGDFPANHRLGTHLQRYVHENIRGDDNTVLRAAGLEGITELDPRIILDPSKFDVSNTTDRRLRIRMGIQTDSQFTGENQGGEVGTVIGT